MRARIIARVAALKCRTRLNEALDASSVHVLEAQVAFKAAFLNVRQVFNFLKAKGSMSNGELDAAMGPVAKIGRLGL